MRRWYKFLAMSDSNLPPQDEQPAPQRSRSSRLYGWVNSVFALLPNWIKKWAGLGLFTWAVAMIQIAEFALAQLLFCLSAVAFLSQIYHWEIPRKSGLVKFIKWTLVLALMIAFVLSTAVNIKIKGRKAWSNLWAEDSPNVTPNPEPYATPSPTLAQPSFVFVKPGVWLNNDTWYFILEHRGTEPVYNIEIIFTDEDRRRAFAADNSRLDLARQTDTILNLPEIDPGNVGYAKYFLWKPLVPEHEHFEAFISHRSGHAKQSLRIERIDGQWRFATRVVDTDRKMVLIECRDAAFPSDEEWGANLPPCLPDYISAPSNTRAKGTPIHISPTPTPLPSPSPSPTARKPRNKQPKESEFQRRQRLLKRLEGRSPQQ